MKNFNIFYNAVLNKKFSYEFEEINKENEIDKYKIIDKKKLARQPFLNRSKRKSSKMEK